MRFEGRHATYMWKNCFTGCFSGDQSELESRFFENRLSMILIQRLIIIQYPYTVKPRYNELQGTARKVRYNESSLYRSAPESDQ